MNKIVSNLVWRFLERCGAQMVSFVVSIILARILEPQAFGTIALIMVFMNILNVFVDSGLGNSLIQKKDADATDYSSVFYFNLFFCVLLYGIVFICAPLIARYYANETLIALIRVLAVTLLISGVKNIQQAYVTKNLMFKQFFFSTLGGTIVSAVIGIILAECGFGVWALVFQSIGNNFLDTVILWFTVKWRPSGHFNLARIKKLFSYGWKLLLANLLDTFYNNLRQILIGKYYSESDLAYYNRGEQIPNLIVVNVNNSIDSVLFPVMSQVQENRQKVKEFTQKAIKTSVFVMAPLLAGLFAIARPLVDWLLTDKWDPAIPYLRIFCVIFVFYPIHTSNLNAIKAMGRSDLFLKLEVIKKLIGLTLLFLTLPHGTMAMAYSLLLSSVASQIINSWPNRKLLGYGYLEQLKDILPSIGLACIMALGIYWIQFLPIPNWLIVMVQILLGAMIYILGATLLKLESVDLVKTIIGDMFHKKEKEQEK